MKHFINTIRGGDCMTKEEIIEFSKMDFNKQVHKCCLTWLHNIHLKPFVGGKPRKEYFICRGYLMKLPRQTIKNICVMLTETEIPVEDVYSLERISQIWVESRQSEEEKKAVKSITDKKEYDIDLKGFLGT